MHNQENQIESRARALQAIERLEWLQSHINDFICEWHQEDKQFCQVYRDLETTFHQMAFYAQQAVINEPSLFEEEENE